MAKDQNLRICMQLRQLCITSHILYWGIFKRFYTFRYNSIEVLELLMVWCWQNVWDFQIFLKIIFSGDQNIGLVWLKKWSNSVMSKWSRFLMPFKNGPLSPIFKVSFRKINADNIYKLDLMFWFSSFSSHNSKIRPKNAQKAINRITEYRFSIGKSTQDLDPKV